MTMCELSKMTASHIVANNHFINKVSFVYRPRSTYSSVYLSSSLPVNAEQSIDIMWWGLQAAHKCGKVLSYAAEVPLRMQYGDIPEANEIEMRLSRIGLMCMQMVGNMTGTSVAIFLLQLATEFGYTVVDIIRKLVDLFTQSVCSTQLYQNMRMAAMSLLTRWGLLGEGGEIAADPVAELINAEASIDIEPSQVVGLAGIMSGVAVILAAGFAGAQDYSPNKGFLKSAAEFGSKAAKMKNGLYAVITVVKDFSAFVKECVMNYFGATPADSVVKAIESMNFTFNGEHVPTKELFEAMSVLNSSDGEEKMSTDMEAYNKGNAICGVLSRVLTGHMVEAFAIPSSSLALLTTQLRSFESRVKSASVKQNVGNVRFTPYCIWIAGDPGCGKSVTLSELVTTLMCVLQMLDAAKFEIPAIDRWCHSANFTQEYHTGYNGQYCFAIDDMCQDKAGTSKNSSALQFIQWVSSVPANVTQAALEDKKCPFRSRIVICTSNELYPNRTHEIVSQEAFLRRRNILISARKAERKDPHLNWPIAFEVCHPTDQNVPRKPVNHFFELVDMIKDDYIRHFEEQTRLVNGIRNGNAEKYLEYCQSKVNSEQSLDFARRSCIDEDCPCDIVETERERQIRLCTESLEVLTSTRRHVFALRRGPFSHVYEADVAPESWAAQNWLMDLSDRDYNIVQSIIWHIDLPVFPFRGTSLTHTANADYLVSPIDARRIGLWRPYRYVFDTMGENFDFVVDNLVEPDVNAEQSAFWTTVTEKIPTWEEFSGQCIDAADRLRVWWEKMRHNRWWMILAGLTTVLGGYLSYKYLTSDSGSWRDSVNAETSYDHNVGRGKPIARSAAHQSYNHEIGRSKAIVTTANAVKSSFVQSVYHKNMVELRMSRGSMNGIFVKGTTLLTCRHFFATLKDGDKFVIVRYPKYSQPIETECEFRKSHMVRVPGTEDAALYTVGKIIDSFKDISTKFCEGAMPETLDAAITSVFPEQEVVVGPATTFVENQTVRFHIGVRDSDVGPDTREIVRVVKGFNFQGHCRRGKSGSPLIADEGVNRAPTIFGIQNSINDEFKISHFEAISASQIKAALGEINAIQSFEEADDRWDDEDEDAWFDAPEDVQQICGKSLEFVGPVKQKVHQASETKLRRSPLAPFFEPMEGTKMFQPAVLKDRSVDILTKSMAGYSRKYGCVDESVLDSVTEQFIMEDRTTRRCLDKRLLTDDEVLNGLHGQGLKGLDLNTSPGIPLTFGKAPGKSGKKTWITMGDDDQRTMCDEMWTKFRAAEKDLRNDKMISLTSYACLKDELRTVEKVQAKKTRSFIVLPLLFNMLIRKYFGHWIALQHRLAGRISSCVGIDANSDWTDLKRRLCAMGEDIEDFDYSDWDRSLHPAFFDAYAQRVSAWYGDKPGTPGYRVRALLMRQLVFMNIQVGDWVLRTHGGNKSGCAITAEINTDIHDELTYYVWKKISLKTGRGILSSLTHFRERVALALYGDDMLKATRGDVTHWFNGNSMKVEIEELGMHITPGDKDESQGFRIKRITDVTFLKRRFMSFDEDSGRVRAPLDKSVIQRMVLWIHKSDSEVDATYANVRGALREAFFWGEDFFRDFTERCQTAWYGSKCMKHAFPLVHYQTVADAWHTGHGDMPAQFQFRVVSGPAKDAEEEL